MNNQEAFDYVLAHMRKQGRPAAYTDLDGGTFCAYRTKDGRMCAAGCLIKDEFYYPGLESVTADSSKVSGALRCSGVNAEIALIQNMQKAHDDVARTGGTFLPLFEIKMRAVAIKWDLVYTPPSSAATSAATAP